MLTLVAINGIDSESESLKNVKALTLSAREKKFDKILFLTARKVKCEYEQIEIPALTLQQYNTFSVYELHKYISTEYALNVQTDGYVLNGDLWMDEFLNYDYIGAAWIRSFLLGHGISAKNLVGNSGFCLRSKKFMMSSAQLPVTSKRYNDDILFCINHYELMMKKYGIKYAPVELAEKFSFELYKTGNTFGFHGKHLDESRKLCL